MTAPGTSRAPNLQTHKHHTKKLQLIKCSCFHAHDKFKHFPGQPDLRKIIRVQCEWSLLCLAPHNLVNVTICIVHVSLMSFAQQGILIDVIGSTCINYAALNLIPSAVFVFEFPQLRLFCRDPIWLLGTCHKLHWSGSIGRPICAVYDWILTPKLILAEHYIKEFYNSYR